MLWTSAVTSAGPCSRPHHAALTPLEKLLLLLLFLLLDLVASLLLFLLLFLGATAAATVAAAAGGRRSLLFPFHFSHTDDPPLKLPSPGHDHRGDRPIVALRLDAF